MKTEFVKRSEILALIDGIWDCCDMHFGEEDHSCRPEWCYGCRWRQTRDYIRSLVEGAPAADVRSTRYAKWIKEYRGQANSICSCCKRESGKRSSFCPSCGAQMIFDEWIVEEYSELAKRWFQIGVSSEEELAENECKALTKRNGPHYRVRKVEHG